MTPKLTGKCVLVLEPDSFSCGYISAVLAHHGAQVVASPPTPEECASLLDNAALDAVVFSLDGGESSETYAELFRRFDTPLLFVSGGRAATSPDVSATPHLRRPFAAFQVVDELASMIAHRESKPR